MREKCLTAGYKSSRVYPSCLVDFGSGASFLVFAYFQVSRSNIVAEMRQLSFTYKPREAHSRPPPHRTPILFWFILLSPKERSCCHPAMRQCEVENQRQRRSGFPGSYPDAISACKGRCT